MTKIYVLNNYSFERVWQEVRDGKKPNHHLYAVDALAENGYEIVLVPIDQKRKHFWSRITHFWKKTKLPIPIGDLYQQMYVWHRLKKGDIIYAPCQTQTQILSYLKRLGLLRNSLIVVAHHPPIRGRFKSLRQWLFKQELKGTTHYPALAQRIATRFNKWVANSSRVLHWGPDISFYQQFSNGNATSETTTPLFLAAGRTGRDFKTLAGACAATNASAHLICLQETYNNQLLSFASNPNIQITANAKENNLLYDELIPMMAAAQVICIPLYQSHGYLAGLTSLTDALALGKAIIMTRNDFINIDLEKAGIGIWVEPGDVAGWQRAIEFFQQHPDECKAMGERALALARTKWNSEVFAEEILTLIKA